MQRPLQRACWSTWSRPVTPTLTSLTPPAKKVALEPAALKLEPTECPPAVEEPRPQDLMELLVQLKLNEEVQVVATGEDNKVTAAFDVKRTT